MGRVFEAFRKPGFRFSGGEYAKARMRALWGVRGDLWRRWRLRQESNLYLPLRRRPFYPLNYGGGNVVTVR